MRPKIIAELLDEKERAFQAQARQKYIDENRNGNHSQSDGHFGHSLVTPSGWFAEKFPSLVTEFGDAILEEADKNGIVSAQDINEDFLAATLSEKGTPDAPTVFIPTEQRFYTYVPNDGVFNVQREPLLMTRLSRLLLECARSCPDGGRLAEEN